MPRYEIIRDKIRENQNLYTCLNAAQLVKHAFALRTEVNRDGEHKGRKPILFYVYAEPECWPGTDGGPVDQSKKISHREEIERFANTVQGDEVRFHLLFLS